MTSPITRRDACVAGLTLAVTIGLGATVLPQTTVLRSKAYDWDGVSARKTAVGESRQFLRSPTATLDELELHVTTLNPGQTSHAPHQHPNEELIIVRDGTVEALVKGQWTRLGPGSVIFNASNESHAIRNAGAGPTTYHVVNWTSPGMMKK